MLDKLTAVRGRFIAEIYGRLLAGPARVLDIGSGSGVVAGIVARELGWEVTCADTERRLVRDLPFVAIEAAAPLPFADRAFRAAMLNDVLHHVTDQAGLIARALRVADRVLVFEVEPGRLIRLFDRVINKLHYGGLPHPETYRTARGWRTFLDGGGWRCRVEPAGKPFWWYPFQHLVIIIEHE